jgi:hypothetical protein
VGTSFNSIYKRALFKFKDTAFSRYTDEVKDVILRSYLLSAIADFHRSSVSPLTYTSNTAEVDGIETIKYTFDAELSNEEQEILALGIAKYWLDNKVMNNEQLKNVLHNSDYKSFSQGAMLSELRGLRAEISNEYDSKIKNYSFRYSDLANLKPTGGF